MRHFRYCLSTVVSAIVAFGLVACKEQKKQELPLLLEEVSVTEELNLPTGPVADNNRCHVCHMNYEDEELALMHARANVGCEQCHGASDAHCSDEDNITPPDIMYPSHKINSSCKSCHPMGKLSGGKKYCTDCHGEHRLSYRTRKWDKATGELIEDDKVRMLTDEMLKQK
ncbi:MAG: multiheme c-type cytochrome [Planctomycetota bacterium]